MLQTVSFISVPKIAWVAEFLCWGRFSVRLNCRGECGAKTGTMCSQVRGELCGLLPTTLTELVLLWERIQASLWRWEQVQLAQWPCTVYHCYSNTNVTAPRNTSNSSTPNRNISATLLDQECTNPECHLARANTLFYLSVSFLKNIASCHYFCT